MGLGWWFDISGDLIKSCEGKMHISHMVKSFHWGSSNMCFVISGQVSEDQGIWKDPQRLWN